MVGDVIKAQTPLRNLLRMFFISVRSDGNVKKAAMAEWLRRLTRNQLGTPRAGSSPVRCECIFWPNPLLVLFPLNAGPSDSCLLLWQEPMWCGLHAALHSLGFYSSMYFVCTGECGQVHGSFLLRLRVIKSRHCNTCVVHLVFHGGLLWMHTDRLHCSCCAHPFTTGPLCVVPAA